MATILNNKIQGNAVCSRCGQVIKNVAIIDGKPYGLDCAATILGLKEIPVWFKGGDYDTQKIDFDKKQAKYKKEFEDAKARIIEFWDDCKTLNKIYNKGNNWVKDFVLSISKQLGLNCIGVTYYDTAEEHIKKTKYLSMSWRPQTNARHINTLSEKQLNILYKNL